MVWLVKVRSRLRGRSPLSHTFIDDQTNEGGLARNTAEKTEACNTMSCDRDRPLACCGGMQSRAKHVLIPTLGSNVALDEEKKRYFV